MDESLSHRYLDLAASHGFGLASDVKSNNPSHSHPQSKNHPVSQGQQSWPWLQSESKMRAVVLSSARVIASAKVRGLVMAMVNQSHSHKFFSQSESTLNWINWETVSHWLICPFLLITSNAGHGHNHSPSHCHAILRIIIIPF